MEGVSIGTITQKSSLPAAEIKYAHALWLVKKIFDYVLPRNPPTGP